MTDTAPIKKLVSVDTLPQSGRTIDHKATADELSALAEAYDLPEISDFRARLTISSDREGDWRVHGRVTARIKQICVVTLDPLHSDVEEDVDIVYSINADAPPHDGGEEIEIDPQADDPPEALTDGVIDLGAIICEHFALGIEPYPRQPGVEFEGGGDEPDRSDSPFAILSKITKPS